jgi:hypothetical protein
MSSYIKFANSKIDIRKLVGFFKNVILLFVTGAIIFVGYTSLGDNEYSLDVKLIGLTLMVLIAFFPLYYLGKTARWDFQNIQYSKDKIAFIGLIIYILISLYYIYMSFDTKIKDFLWGNILFCVITVIIGIRDFKRFLSAFKSQIKQQ